MVEVTVVIPNFNGEKFLKGCLDSLKKQTFSDFKSIVVDNGSKDNSLSILENYRNSVEVIRLNENTGFCGAVNIGIQASDSPYVILLNNDVEVEDTFVEEMIKAIKNSPKLFSCSAKLVKYHNRKLIDDAGNYYSALGWAFARGTGKEKELFQKPDEIFASCGGAAIYNRSILNKIGLFDEKHFAYLEDIDIGYRAKIYGYKNRFEPKAVVYHVGSGTSGSRYNTFKVNCSSRNSIYLIYKNMPLLQILLNSPFLIAGFFIKTLFFIKKGLGKEYVCGLLEGVKLCKKEKKVKFEFRNLKNYIIIQLELWVNIGRRLLS